MSEQIHPNWKRVHVKRNTVKDLSETVDAGIQRAVIYFLLFNIVTFQSCEGKYDLDGKNSNLYLGTHEHCYPVPTVDFGGDRSEGWRALSVVLYFNLPVDELRRVYRMEDGEMRGPIWSMTFLRRMKPLSWEDIESIVEHLAFEESSA